MKSRIKMKGLIAVLIIAVSLLHYFGDDRNSAIHSFFRLLYFIPILLAAFNFGFKGGVSASLAVGLIYSPIILLTLHTFNAQTINEFLDIVLFFIVGIIAGTLVEKKNLSFIRLNDELKRYMLLENYTSSIIESIKSGVIAVNSDLFITMANQGAINMIGIGNGCIGQSFTEVFDCCVSVKESIDKAFNENIQIENIELLINRNSKELNLRISIYPLNFENVKKGLVIIIDDITEMKKLQKQLMRNDKLAALGELSAGVAHEIRNPLGIIKAIEQTMKNELESNEEALKELEIIDEEIERANKVIKSLMDYGKPAQGEKAIYSMDSVIDDVLVVTNKYILQHKVEVVFNKSGDANVLIDKEVIKQALVNVIFNAVQAMPDGGKLTISTVNIHDLFVKIIFRDTGVGIKEEIIDKIFNPFFTTKEDGTGLGLSIVHKIIEEHRGAISVNSRENWGTVFEIMLPARSDITE